MTVNVEEKKNVKKPTYFVKRDGSKMNFASYKLGIVFDEMGLQKQKKTLIKEILKSIGSMAEVDAHEVHRAVISVLNKAGYQTKALDYINVYKKK